MYNSLILRWLFIISLACLYSYVFSVRSHLKSSEYSRDCREVYHNAMGKKSEPEFEIHVIKPTGSPEPFLVQCYVEKNKHWRTVILNRFNGRENFNRTWHSYKVGFGNLLGEFWLGLDKIYYMTRFTGNYSLAVHFKDFDGNTGLAFYRRFSIGGPEEDYRLKIAFSGADTGLERLAGMRFSTYDNDHDRSNNVNCGEKYGGGWWYYSEGCTNALATGPWTILENRIFWKTFSDIQQLKEIRMTLFLNTIRVK